MAVGHGLLTSTKLCIIIYIYLSITIMCWPVDSSLSHSSKPMLLYVSDEVMASKPTFNLRPHASPTASTKEFSLSSHLVVVYRLAFNMYISTLLITIWNDVAINPGPSLNLTQQLPSTCGLKISHLNIRSMYPKLDAIRLLLRDQPFDIFTISETWLNPTITDQELLIPGYTILWQDRSRKLGGGIAVYIFVMEFLTANVMILRRTKKLRAAGLKLPDLRLIICTIYRAPNFLLTNFIDELNTSISKLPDNIELVILGDFNVDFGSNLNGNRPLRSKLKSLANLHNLEQLIQTVPSRGGLSRGPQKIQSRKIYHTL